MRRYKHAHEDIVQALLGCLGRPVPDLPGMALIPGQAPHTLIKVRARSRDMQRGRSGGFRIILAHCGDDEWVPVMAYAKSDTANMTRRELADAVRGDGEPGERAWWAEMQRLLAGEHQG